jgi:hypothetical protein
MSLSSKERARDVCENVYKLLTDNPIENRQTLQFAIEEAIDQAVKDEREACAEVAEDIDFQCDHLTCERDWCDDKGNDIASAIRNRGEKEL